MPDAPGPDRVKAVEGRDALRRYFDVLDGSREPKWRLCRSISVDFSAGDADEVLWNKHSEGIKELNRHKDRNNERSEAEKTLMDLKAELANRIFRECCFCERRCGVDRRKKAGVCGVKSPRISSMFHHYGEESELVPSFTIFFSGCNFKCRFCQNFDISQRVTGYGVTPNELAKKLEEISARNINWVGGSPTPNMNFILETLNHYNGVLPSVWNSNMYMTEEAMRLLEGTHDIFLTDLKYGNDDCAEALSKVKDYSNIVRRNHQIAMESGELIVRHLVLPNHLECCTKEVVGFVADRLGRDTRFNLMFQYRPLYRANEIPEINRGLQACEISRAREIAAEAGLKNVIS